jgi:hypothetical protein
MNIKMTTTDTNNNRDLIPDRARIFLFTMSRPALGLTQPPIQWLLGALSLGVKWPGHEADHSIPSRAKVKNVWSHTSTPPYIFLMWYFVKHRELHLYLCDFLI